MSEQPAWRETPFGRVVRYLGERPHFPMKHERWAVAIGVTEAWEDDAKDGTTAIHVLSRTTPRHDRVIVPHCSRGLRPCWCWPDEEHFKIEQA